MALAQILVACTSTIVIAIFCACLAGWVYLRRRIPPRWANLPPGPKPEPILGNLRLLVKEKGIGRLKIFDEIGKKYGGIYTLWFGKQPKVIVTDYELMKHMQNEEVFTGRPYRFFSDRFMGRLGLVYSDGQIWKDHRPFASKTLRDFGFGKPWLAGLIVEEAKEMIRELEAMQSHPVNPSDILNQCVANVICTISFGKQGENQDEQFRHLAALVSSSIRLTAKNVFVAYFPFLRHIPLLPFRKLFLQLEKNQHELDAFCVTLMDEHKNRLVEGEEPRDYIDAYLIEQNRQKDNPKSTFTKKQLSKSILTLFGAGVETTANVLAWALIYLVENPLVYRRLQKEVDEVIPDGGFPNYELDRPRLTYLEATTMEVLRLSMPVPVPARRPLEETELKGYKIPNDITILPIMFSVHYNPDYFPEPYKFDPTRYLDAAGQLKRPPPEGYQPFTGGRRSCYGESLAKMELIIFLASLVKHFEFRTPPGQVISSADSLLGLTNVPIPYEMIFAPRSGGRRFSIIGNGIRLWE